MSKNITDFSLHLFAAILAWLPFLMEGNLILGLAVLIAVVLWFLSRQWSSFFAYYRINGVILVSSLIFYDVLMSLHVPFEYDIYYIVLSIPLVVGLLRLRILILNLARCKKAYEKLKKAPKNMTIEERLSATEFEENIKP